MLITLLFSFLFGWSWPFLNRSSHQSIYTSRLIRAYLGASNWERLVATGKSVTQAISGDDIKQEDYWPRFRWLAHRSDRDAEKTDQLFQEIHADEEQPTSKGDAAPSGERYDQRDPGRSLRKSSSATAKGSGWRSGRRRSASESFTIIVVDRAGPSTAELQAEVYPPEGKKVLIGSSVTTISVDRPARLHGRIFDARKLDGNFGGRIFDESRVEDEPGISLLAGLANVRLTYWWNSGVKPFDRFTTRSCSPKRQQKMAPLH